MALDHQTHVRFGCGTCRNPVESRGIIALDLYLAPIEKDHDGGRRALRRRRAADQLGQDQSQSMPLGPALIVSTEKEEKVVALVILPLMIKILQK